MRQEQAQEGRWGGGGGGWGCDSRRHALGAEAQGSRRRSGEHRSLSVACRGVRGRGDCTPFHFFTGLLAFIRFCG